MSKLSINPIYPTIIGVAVWIAGVSPATANSTNIQLAETSSNIAAQPVAEPVSLRLTNSLSDRVVAAPTSEQIIQATEATEIKPGEWAYQTLQALNAKYGCSDQITGDRTLSREEFAISLNGCVQSIEQLVAKKPRKQIRKRRTISAPAVVTPPATPNIVPPPPAPVEMPAPAEPQVSQQDLEDLKQLVQSFGIELQGVDARIEALDKKTTALKATSFSTTTKLAGEVIFGVSGYGGVKETATRQTNGNVFTDRVRLNFDTSFTGKDKLRTRLQSRNNIAFNSAVTGTSMTQLGYDGNSDNNTSLSLLQYTFPLSSQTKIIAETVGSEFNENMYTFNPLLTSSGGGSISRFGRYNPVYRLSADGASLTVNHQFSQELGLTIGYAVPGSNTAANPAANSGLFNGSNAIISQLTFRPDKALDLGLVYARSYHTGGSGVTGGTGSSAANNPFGGAKTSANHYSFLASYKLDRSVVISGWAGFSDATRETTDGGTASTSNYAVSVAFPDFAQKGNNLAFILGVPPKLNSRSGTGLAATTDKDTSLHIEALYKMKLTDNIDLTPGLLLISNPEHNSTNPTIYVGTVRTTFKF